MPLKGARAHTRRLQALASATTEREIGAALFAAGELIQIEAQRSITAGAVSGRGHVPSAPGEPPNNDTGTLADNIETTQPARTRVLVTSNAPYSAAQEFGADIVNAFGNGTAVTLPARPFMRPARDAKKQEAKKLVEKALNRAVKRSRRSD